MNFDQSAFPLDYDKERTSSPVYFTLRCESFSHALRINTALMHSDYFDCDLIKLPQQYELKEEFEKDRSFQDIINYLDEDSHSNNINVESQDHNIIYLLFYILVIGIFLLLHDSNVFFLIYFSFFIFHNLSIEISFLNVKCILIYYF